MLYIAMEDFEIDWIIGQGPRPGRCGSRSPFTLVGATTKAGSVSSPLASRFGITAHIEFYNEEELANIIDRSSKIIDVRISEDAVLTLARCSRGTPRIANRLLRRLRDFASVLGEGTITSEIVHTGLKRLGIDQRDWKIRTGTFFGRSSNTTTADRSELRPFQSASERRLNLWKISTNPT